VTPNHTLERTMIHRGRTVLAMECVLGGAQWRSCPAAQLDRYAAFQASPKE
jgi:hypothetical protein